MRISDWSSDVCSSDLRYTPDHSSVTVRLRKLGADCVIEVEDCGPGIPQDRIESVFQPFVRLSQARDRASGGYGLGLAIAKRGIDATGSHIRSSNRERGGIGRRWGRARSVSEGEILCVDG